MLGGYGQKDALRYPIIVESPVYLKPWFITLIILGIIGCIVCYIWWRTYKLQKEKEKLEKIIESRTKTIEKQKAKLQASNAMKDQLFALIGHDLRGPLFSLQGLEVQINYLLETQQMDRLKSLGASMERTSKGLSNTLDNLLNWALSEMGKFPYKPASIKLESLMLDTKNLLLIQAQNKEVNLLIDISVGLKVYADQNALSTILRNLISNAIKFTERGGKVEITGRSKGNMAKITVMDDGIGMSSQQVQKLLEGNDFKRQRGTEGEKSTGLGIHLCKKLIEQNQGKLSIYSKRGEGSCFTFLIPLSESLDPHDELIEHDRETKNTTY